MCYNVPSVWLKIICVSQSFSITWSFEILGEILQTKYGSTWEAFNLDNYSFCMQAVVQQNKSPRNILENTTY
jgi:hypothetical protein